MRSADPVICFDLDDTLYSESDYVESGLRAVGAWLDARAPGDEPADGILLKLWRRARAPDGFQQLLRARGLDVDSWLPRLREVYRTHAPEIQARDGVASLLASLVARGASLALVSDGLLEVQRRKWAALRLQETFDPLVFTDERGRAYWKPHPWAFERVMAAHPSASRFVYVGDNPAKDFIAPNKLGWTTVMISDPRNIHGRANLAAEGAPLVELDSLDGLLALLDERPCRTAP